MPTLEQATFERVLAESPDDLRDARRAAYDAFRAASMPSPKDEAWRYVDLDFDLHDMPLATEAGMAPASPYLEALTDRAATVRIVDGFVTTDGDVPGLTIGDGGLPSEIDDIFSAAAAAFGRHPVRIAAAGTIDAPVVVEVCATQPGTASFPILDIVVGDDAEMSVVIVLHSTDDRLVVAPQVSASVADAGRLALTTVQAWGSDTRAVIEQRVTVGRQGSVKIGEVGLGGALARLDLAVDLQGDGASNDMSGIYFGDGAQVLDYRIVIHHRGKNTSSNVFLKGAVEDEAESVFTGLLKIWPDATNTSTFETNRNLVLSDGAKAHSVPNLEILCDDVVCGHGSTVGPLESDQLYYLRSRGLSKDRAERLLLRGFFEEIIQRLPAPQLSSAVRTAVNQKFTRAQAEGRVA